MKFFFGVVIIILGAVVGGIFISTKSGNLSKQAPTPSENRTMEIASTSFQNNTPIPKKYTCDGVNINPAFSISNVPAAAKSLALIVSDSDAPGGDFIHWLVWNITPTTTQIAEGTAPTGAVVGENDFSKNGYSGPCPPSGTHRYIYTIYALDTILRLDSGAKKIDVQKTIAGHLLSAPALIGTYSR